jgi:hypothetical protein
VPTTGDWRARFDAAADDLRAALGWAADQPDHRAGACDPALSMAELAFTRNLAGESQRRFEQAATLTDDATASASALRDAAAVAGCRMAGDEIYRLDRAAADAARRAGDTAGAARDLAAATTAVYRFAGVFARLPPPGEAAALLTSARDLAGDDPAAKAAVALADCGVLADAFIAELAEPVNARPFLTRDDLLAFLVALICHTGLEPECAKGLRANCLTSPAKGYVSLAYLKRRAPGDERKTLRVADGGALHHPGGLLRLAQRLTQRGWGLLDSEALWVEAWDQGLHEPLQQATVDGAVRRPVPAPSRAHRRG